MSCPLLNDRPSRTPPHWFCGAQPSLGRRLSGAALTSAGPGACRVVQGHLEGIRAVQIREKKRQNLRSNTAKLVSLANTTIPMHNTLVPLLESVVWIPVCTKYMTPVLGTTPRQGMPPCASLCPCCRPEERVVSTASEHPLTRFLQASTATTRHTGLVRSHGPRTQINPLLPTLSCPDAPAVVSETTTSPDSLRAQLPRPSRTPRGRILNASSEAKELGSTTPPPRTDHRRPTTPDAIVLPPESSPRLNTRSIRRRGTHSYHHLSARTMTR